MTSPSFDRVDYEERVFKVMRRQGKLADDLVVRYDVDPSWDDARLQAHLRSVRSYWNQKSNSGNRLGDLAKAAKAADEKMQKDPHARLDDIAWWREQFEKRSRARRVHVDRLATTLRQTFGELEAVSPAGRDAVAASFTMLSEAEVAVAVEQAGLEVVEPVELPRPPLVPRAADLVAALGLADAASVPHLLHPELTSFRLLDGFVAAPPVTGGLDDEAVAARVRRIDQEPDSDHARAAKDLLGRLRNVVSSGVDLPTLTLVLLLHPVREQRAKGAPPAASLFTLRESGLDERDARLLALSIAAEGAAGESVDPTATSVARLLGEGMLAAARQEATVMSGDGAGPVRAKVEAQSARVESLRAAARAELSAGHIEEAARLLNEAYALARDLPELAAELTRIPPPAVAAMRVRADGAGVRLSWEAATSHDADTVYRVVRRTDRAPGDPADGAAVAFVVGDTTATDAEPPVGRTAGYAVFAARSGAGPWSRPATAMQEVVPPVADVRAQAERGAVALSWTVHPAASSVEVRRHRVNATDGGGTVVTGAGRRSARDASVTDGATYSYRLVARYPCPRGGPDLCSEAVVVRGAARVDAVPVPVLRVVVEDEGAATPTLAVSWRAPAGADTVVRSSVDGRPPWEFGAIVGTADADAWGAVLPGAAGVEGDWTVVRLPAPSGRRHYVVFTRGDDGEVVGQDQAFDLTPAPRQVRCEQRGTEAVVSWVWPEDVGEAEVRWPGGRRRVTRSGYQQEGGVRLLTSGAGRAEVVCLSGRGEHESRSTAVAVELAPVRPSVRYSLRREGSRLFGAQQAVATVAPGQGGARLGVVLVVAEGPVMPRRVADGRVVAQGDVDLGAGGSLSAELPRLRRPYWIRCFPADPDGVVLVDPPVTEMKVS